MKIGCVDCGTNLKHIKDIPDKRICHECQKTYKKPNKTLGMYIKSMGDPGIILYVCPKLCKYIRATTDTSGNVWVTVDRIVEYDNLLGAHQIFPDFEND